MDQVRLRTSSWNSILLSLASRLTLISSILSALSVYSLLVFKILVSVVRKLNALIVHFLWARVRKSRVIHWCSKDVFSLPKTEGGWAYEI